MTPWAAADQASLSVEFCRQEYWSGYPFPPPGNLPDPGIEPRSPTLQADSLLSEPPGKPSTGLGTVNCKGNRTSFIFSYQPHQAGTLDKLR